MTSVHPTIPSLSNRFSSRNECSFLEDANSRVATFHGVFPWDHQWKSRKKLTFNSQNPSDPASFLRQPLYRITSCPLCIEYNSSCWIPVVGNWRTPLGSKVKLPCLKHEVRTNARSISLVQVQLKLQDPPLSCIYT